MTDSFRQYFTGEMRSSTAARCRTPARREITFLFSRLQDLVPTNHDCYLTACKGSLRIIDRYRPAVSGSRILIELNGKCDWAQVRLNPYRFITEEGCVIQDERLDQVTVIGVAIREVMSTYLANGVSVSGGPARA